MFFDVLEANNIPQPKILALSKEYEIEFDNHIHVIEDESSLQEIILDLINESKFKAIFIKPDEGYGGFNSYKVDLDNATEISKKICDSMNNYKYIFQEVIKQHSAIDNIYDKCVNSLRIHTYKDPKTDQIEITSALMRFGSGGSVVDNISSGGMFVPIDLSEWKLVGKGRTFLKSGGYFYERHPDSNIKFNGYKLPYKDEIYDIVKKVSREFDNEMIGGI